MFQEKKNNFHLIFSHNFFSGKCVTDNIKHLLKKQMY